MNLFRPCLFSVRSQFTVGALALLCTGFIGLSQESQASTASWSQQPSWADDGGSPSTSRKSFSHDSRYDISPFAPGSNNLALDLGQVFLMGDLSSKYSDNIGAQLHYTYGVSEIFGFDSSLGYSEHSNGAYSVATLLTGLRTNLAWYDKVVPYLVFGLGFYKPTLTIPGTGANTASTTVSPVLFGVHLGPGIDLELTKSLFFGAAITFHDIFGESKAVTGLSQDIGGTFTTFYVHAGVTF